MEPVIVVPVEVCEDAVPLDFLSWMSSKRTHLKSLSEMYNLVVRARFLATVSLDCRDTDGAPECASKRLGVDPRVTIRDLKFNVRNKRPT